MFDEHDYADRMEKIRLRRMMSLHELAREVGLSYCTLKPFLAKIKETPLLMSSMRKIKQFVEANEREQL